MIRALHELGIPIDLVGGSALSCFPFALRCSRNGIQRVLRGEDESIRFFLELQLLHVPSAVLDYISTVVTKAKREATLSSSETFETQWSAPLD